MGLKQSCKCVFLVLVLLKVVLCFDVDEFCRMRCLRGSGGLLCDCTVGHFSGKRSSLIKSTLHGRFLEGDSSDFTTDPKLNLKAYSSFLYKALPKLARLGISRNVDDDPRESSRPFRQPALSSANTDKGAFHQPSIMAASLAGYAPYSYLSSNADIDEKMDSDGVLVHATDRLSDQSSPESNSGKTVLSLLHRKANPRHSQGDRDTASKRNPPRRYPYANLSPYLIANGANGQNNKEKENAVDAKFDSHPLSVHGVGGGFKSRQENNKLNHLHQVIAKAFAAR